MVLESTMVCVDDSDFMRNGDFAPTRMAAMQDAVQVVCNAKTRSNPENNVGLLTLASSEVLSTLTTDPNKIISKLLAVQPEGEIKLMSGLRVAHLALKHRQGKNHRMRIIVFIGSPLDELDTNDFIRLAKKFKKEKVNVDVISFGEKEEAKNEKLQKFIDTLNGEDGSNSRLISVSSRTDASLTNALRASTILVTEDGINMAGGPGGNFDFGMDPNDDPELALALRVSMEEQRARQEAESRSTAADEGADAGPTPDEQMLEQALALSMGGAGVNRPSAPVAGAMDFSAMSEDEQIAYALQMSMQDSGGSSEVPTPSDEGQKMEQEIAGAASGEDAKSGSLDSSEDIEMEDVESKNAATANPPEVGNALRDTEFLQRILEDLPEGPQVNREVVDTSKGAEEKEKDDTDKNKKGNNSKSAAGTSSPASGKSGGTSSSTKKSPAGSDKKKQEPKKNPGPPVSPKSPSSARSTKSSSSKESKDKKKPDPKKK